MGSAGARIVRENYAAIQEAVNLRAGLTADGKSTQAAQAVEAANLKNEARDTEIRSIFDQMLENSRIFGQSQNLDITRQREQLLAQNYQNQIDRGLLDSSTTFNQERAILDDASRAQLALKESVLGIQNSILAAKAGYIERISNTAPSDALFAELARAAASAPTTSAFQRSPSEVPQASGLPPSDGSLQALIDASLGRAGGSNDEPPPPPKGSPQDLLQRGQAARESLANKQAEWRANYISSLKQQRAEAEARRAAEAAAAAAAASSSKTNVLSVVGDAISSIIDFF